MHVHLNNVTIVVINKPDRIQIELEIIIYVKQHKVSFLIKHVLCSNVCKICTASQKKNENGGVYKQNELFNLSSAFPLEKKEKMCQ